MNRLLTHVLSMLALSTGAIAGTSANPAVPPGKPSSSVTIAVVGDGVDYTKPAVAALLARDGEGEVIGYDVRDDDHRPFPDSDASAIGTVAAELIGTEAPEAHIVPVRADMADTASLARALAYVLRSPAEIVFPQLDGAYKTGWDVIARAAKKFETHLFVVASGDDGLDLSSASGDVISRNVLVVAAAAEDGALLASSSHGAEKVDIGAFPGLGIKPTSQIAATRIVALAARIKAAEPGITAAMLKLRIVGLARQTASSPPFATKYGVIADPARSWLAK